MLSFGGPEGQDDVIPFLRNVTAGRGIPDERLEEVAHHYRHFGGVSPINDHNRELKAALDADHLVRFGASMPAGLYDRVSAAVTAAVLADVRAVPGSAELARRIGISRQNLNLWRTHGVRGLPARATLEGIATVIGRTYQSVLEAALRDAGYLDGPWTTTDDH